MCPLPSPGSVHGEIRPLWPGEAGPWLGPVTGTCGHLVLGPLPRSLFAPRCGGGNRGLEGCRTAERQCSKWVRAGTRSQPRGRESRRAPCPWPHHVTRPPRASASCLTNGDNDFYLARGSQNRNAAGRREHLAPPHPGTRPGRSQVSRSTLLSPDPAFRAWKVPSQRKGGRKSVDRSLTPPPKLHPPGHAALASALAFHPWKGSGGGVELGVAGRTGG